MNNLMVFKREEFGQIRSMKIDEDPWFVGKDVATALGYARTADAIKAHVDAEDKLTRCFTDSGQSRRMTVVNESGMYSLIFGSKLPSAKKFKRWVTDEVLPTIRKTGSYSTGVQQSMPLPKPVHATTTIITKTYKGQIVLTVRDMTTLTGIHRDSINHYLRKYDMFVKGVDYLHISGLELQRFKHVNDGVSHMTNGLNLITQKGARKIAVYSPNYSPEMEKQISRLYGQGQFENVLDESQKQTDGEDLQQRYTRITEAQILMEAASKIDDPFYKEYVYKNVTAMMMAGSPKTGTSNEDPAGIGFFYRLGALLASTDKKGRDDIRNKIIAELKSEGNSDGVVASANEFFILAESVLAE